jgi:hypothetical protein
MEQRIAYLLQKCSSNDLTTVEEEELNAFFPGRKKPGTV